MITKRMYRELRDGTDGFASLAYSDVWYRALAKIKAVVEERFGNMKIVSSFIIGKHYSAHALNIWQHTS